MGGEAFNKPQRWILDDFMAVNNLFGDGHSLTEGV